MDIFNKQVAPTELRINEWLFLQIYCTSGVQDKAIIQFEYFEKRCAFATSWQVLSYCHKGTKTRRNQDHNGKFIPCFQNDALPILSSIENRMKLF